MSSPEQQVGLIMRHFYPALAGDSERFRRYAPGLSQRGIAFRVLTSRHEKELPEQENVDGAISVRRVNVVNPLEGQIDDRKLFEAAGRSSFMDPKTCKVIQTTLARTPVVRGQLALRAVGHKLIHVCTMVGMENPSQTAAQRLKNTLRHVFCQMPFHKLVVSSEEMMRWSVGLGAGRRRMVVIPHGVNLARFCPIDDLERRRALRRELNIPAAARVVLFVGSVIPRKGLHLLLDAWPAILAACPDSFLALVGPTYRPTAVDDAEREYLSRYQAQIQTKLAEIPPNSCGFFGERNDVERFYQSSDLFVLPSEQEGMANVILEAYASGVPALLTECAGLPEKELGTESIHFRRTRRDVQSLSNAVTEMLSNRQSLSKMGDSAKNWAKDNLSLDLALDRYANLYRTLGQKK